MRQPIVMPPRTDPLGEAALGLVQGLTTGLLHGQQMKMQRQQQRQQREEDLRWQIAQQTGDFSILEEQIPIDAIEDFEQAFGKIQQINERQRLSEIENQASSEVVLGQKRLDRYKEMYPDIWENLPYAEKAFMANMMTHGDTIGEENIKMMLERHTGEELRPPEHTMEDINSKKMELARLENTIHKWETDRRWAEDNWDITQAYVDSIRPAAENLKWEIEEMKQRRGIQSLYKAQAQAMDEAMEISNKFIPQFAAEHGLDPNEPLNSREWAAILDKTEEQLLESGYRKSQVESLLLEIPNEYPELLRDDVSIDEIMSYRGAGYEPEKPGRLERIGGFVSGLFPGSGESTEPKLESPGEVVDFTNSILSHTRGGGVGPKSVPIEMYGRAYNLPEGSYWQEGEVVRVNDAGFRAILSRPDIEDEADARAFMNRHGMRYGDE